MFIRLQCTLPPVLSVLCSVLLLACGPSKGTPTPGTPADPCTIDAPVCGADGLEYANACAASMANVETVWAGPCSCDLALETAATTTEIQGSWQAYGQWPIELQIHKDGSIARFDWVGDCAYGTACDGSGYVVSQGKWSISGPLIHLTWTQPTVHPNVQLPFVLLWEPACPDGKPYVVELQPQELFFTHAD